MAATVSVTGASNVEGTTSGDPNYLLFAITLSEAASASAAVTVQYRLWSGTAQAGSDVYDYFSGSSVTFAPGETSKTVAWRIDGDFVDEADEAVVLEVFSVSGGAALAGNASVLRATGWVLDDDGSGNKLAMFASQPLVVEGDSGTRQANFEISLSRPAPQAFSVAYTTVDGSAHAGEDYTATSGTLSFVAGQTSASVSVPVLGDTTPEPSDSFTLAFTTPDFVAQASLGEATILDDDAGPVVVSVAGSSNIEGTTSGDPNYLQFAITLSEAASAAVTVQYRLWSGTAQAGSDVYDYFSGSSVTFAPGETSKTVAWRIDGDFEVETDEAVVLEVYSVTGGGAALAGNASVLRATGWVLDDDGSGNKLALFASQPLVVEGDSGTRQANFEISLSRPAPEAFSVAYTTVDGSAHAGEDYVATSGTLSFVAGQTSASVSVPVTGDTTPEPSDSFTLAFTAPDFVAQAALGEATILDDDAGPIVVSVAGASNVEGTTSADPNYLQFAITLSEAAGAPITVGYRLLSGTATADSDVYDYFSGSSVTFAPGETSKTVAWRIDGDFEAETDEAVVLEVYGVSGGAALAGNATVLRATGWVLDDDGSGNKLALYASRPVMVEGDSGTRQANFDISLSRPAPEAFSVAYTTVDGSAHAGQDYVATSGTLSFVKGQTSASVSVEVIGDTVSEPSDSFMLAFETPPLIAATSIGEALILDDDAGTPVVSVTGGSNFEGTTSGDPNYLRFAITLSEAAGAPITVGYRLLSGTATAGADVYDYFTGDSVTFAPGETSKTVAWRIDGDFEAETDEAVVLEVFSVSGGAALAGNATLLRATGWVLDDDGSGNKLSLFTSRPVVVEGDDGNRQANFDISLSRPAPGPISLNYHTVDVTGHAGSDYVATSGTLNFVTGQTSASVSVPVIGDSLVEPSEIFLLAFDKPVEVVQASLGEALVLDDDAGTPTVSIIGASNFEGTTSADPAYLSFGITLSAPAAAPVTVGYRLLSGTATAGADVYDYFSGSAVTFAPGETSKTVAWRIRADSVDEVDEAVVMELTGVSGNARFADGVSALRATGWVLDDDGTGNNLAMFAESPQIAEGVQGYDRDAAVVVRLSRPGDTAIDLAYTTVAGTATADSDFTPVAGTLHFAPLQTVAAVQVPVIGDAVNEADEAFTLQFAPAPELASGTAGTTSTVTILDGDRLPPPAPLAIEAGSNLRLTEGSTLQRGVVLSDGQDDGGAGWNYTIDYGDGSVVTGHLDALNLALNHTYADGPARYTVDVTVTDTGGESASDSFTVDVDNVAPTIALSGAGTAARGASYTLNLGVPFDPANAGGQNIDTVTEYRIDWGDGSALQVIEAADLPASRQLTHTYTSIGQRTIGVTLVDEDGTYRNAGTHAVAVDVQPDFSAQLALPDSLAPGEEGLARFSYANISGGSLDGILVYVQARAALLRDPLTGEYTDSLLLTGRGDGEGLVAAGETGVLDFAVKQANAPLGRADITVSIVDGGAPLDAAALGQALRPSFLQDGAWQRIYANFVTDAAGSTQALVTALAQNSALVAGLGAEGSSAATALAFELEQAGDFGSIAERSTPGSLGDGWAFIGDVALDIGADGDVAWRGSTDLDALVSLSPGAAAQYTVSSSVGVSVGLDGAVRSGAPADRPVFTRTIDGSYSANTAFDGTLVRTGSGYELQTAGGGVLRFGSDGLLLEVVTATGRTTQVTHDEQGRITGFTAGQNNTLTIQRDAEGHATALVDEYGQTTTLTYAEGQLVQAGDAAGTASFGYGTAGDLASATPAGGPATTFQYDDHGRLAGIEVAGAPAATIAYDSQGGYTWSSAEGQQLAVQLAPGGVASQVQVGGTTASELVYDVSGKLAGAQLADGSQLHFDIDGQGRLTAITDPTGATVRYAYEGDSTRPASFTDGGGATRSFAYDDSGRLAQATWADGTALQFSYNAEGNLSGYTNRRGDASTYQYDANGHLVSRTDAGGDLTYGYDSLGRVTAVTRAAGTPDARTTEIGYDDASRVTHIGYPDGRTLDYGYDDAGRRSTMTDQDGNVQSYSYDAAGRLVTVSYNGARLVAYGYDGDGRLVEESNGNGTRTECSYDDRGLLTAIVNFSSGDAESSAYRYGYDETGQRVGMQTPHGDWVYGYDGAGQLTSAQFTVNATGLAAGLADKSLVYAYDAAGNRTSVVEDGLTTTYVSNALNQYTQVGDTTYTYDADGNQTGKTVGGQTWAYAYNADNRLVQITGPQGEVTQYEYDVFGNRSAVIENGVRTELLVDPFALGMGSPVAEYSGDQRVASYFYGLNAIAQQTGSGTYYFEGDAVGSVTGVTGTGGTLANAYAYDPFGRELLETETVKNRLEFNGLFGVEEATDGLSYMRARFYDAEQGRFTAEDPLWLNGDIANLTRFGANDPVSNIDPAGLKQLYAIDVSLKLAVPWGSAGIGFGVFRDADTGDIGIFGFGGDRGWGLGASANISASYIPEGRSSLEGNRTDTSMQFGVLGKADSLKPLAHAMGLWDIAYGLTQNSISVGPGIGLTVIPVRTWAYSAGDLGDWLGRLAADAVDLGHIAARALVRALGLGDPHLRTFDGLSYDFQAAGEFVYARGTGLELQVRQEPWGSSKHVAVNTAVAMQMGDAVVGLYLGQSAPLNINGEWVSLDIGKTKSVGGGSVYRHDFGTYVVVTPQGDGFLASLGGSYINVHAFVGDERGDDVAGLLGNSDGNRANDLALADGTALPNPVPVTQLYGIYADSWRVTPQTSLFVYGAGESTETYTDRSFPVGIVTLDSLDPAVRAAAEQIARDAGLTEGTWEFDSAVLDVALTGLPDFAAGAAQMPASTEQPTPAELQHPPVVVADTASTLEDTAVAIDVLANDSDPEGDLLQIVSASDASGGAVNIVDGALHLTPAANFNGVTRLDYSVSDGAGNTVAGTVEVTVQAVNDLPEPTVDQYAVLHGRTLEIDAAAGLLANDGDADGDALTVTGHGGAAHGSIELAEDGSFRYTPDAGFIGTETIVYTVSDGTASASGSFTIEVANAAPTLALDGAVDTDEGQAYLLSIAASDQDNAALGIRIDWGDGSAAQTLSTADLAALGGQVSHVFADDEDGAVNASARTILVTVSDGDGGSTSLDKVVTVHNVAPTIALSGADSTVQGAAFSLLLGAVTDPGHDTPSAYVVDWGDGTAPQGQSTAGEVTHVYAGSGSRTVQVSVVDEDGTFVAGSHAVTVVEPPPNAAPVPDDDSYSVYAGRTLSVDASSGVLAGDTDANGDTLGVDSFDTTGLQGTLDLGPDGRFTFTPDAGFVGTTGFDYVVSDGRGGTGTGHVSIEVMPVPVETVRIGDAPVRQSGAGGQWAAAWSDDRVNIVHKADATSSTEAWSAAALHAVSPQTLAGGDIYQGDLGVSGQSLATSSVRQEIDGKEVLRFDLHEAATEVRLDLSRFQLQDDGGLFFESGRLRLLDAQGKVVGETSFRADSADGSHQVGLAAAAGFVAVELSAGAYDGNQFVFGAYADGNGHFASAPSATHGSEFLVDWIEFDFPLLGVQQDQSVVQG